MPFWKYLEAGGKRAVSVCHRRWGKDDVSLHWTACAAMERVGNYWHLLPQYSQARKAVWEAVNPRTGKRRIDEAFPAEIRSQTKEQEMFIRFVNGSTWQLIGSDNYDTLVGTPPVGLVNSEYALADPRAWAFLRPILAENNGWAIFVFTPRGINHGKRIYDLAKSEPDWFAQLLTVDDSPVFNKDTLAQELRELQAEFGETEGEMLWQQEYYCSFEGFTHGAYWGKQIRNARLDGRITSVPYDPGMEVNTAWDLGWDDSTSIWFFQVCGREIHFIDYYENVQEPLSHYAQVLKSKPYVYGTHYQPHDIEVHELTTGKSRRQTLEDLGIRPINTVRRANNHDALMNQIDAARNILARCWFDEKKCGPRGIPCLEGYRAEYDEVKRKLGNQPVHDYTSHGASAFRTFAVGWEPRIVLDEHYRYRRSYAGAGASPGIGWLSN